MTEWLKAGYFLPALLVKRQCDDRFYMLGDLMAATGSNPFQSHLRFPLVKPEVHKIPEPDVLHQLQMLQAHQSQFAMRQANERSFGQGEPWASMNSMQQRDIFAQQLLNQPQVNNCCKKKFPYLLQKLIFLDA